MIAKFTRLDGRIESFDPDQYISDPPSDVEQIVKAATAFLGCIPRLQTPRAAATAELNDLQRAYALAVELDLALRAGAVAEDQNAQAELDELHTAFNRLTQKHIWGFRRVVEGESAGGFVPWDDAGSMFGDIRCQPFKFTNEARQCIDQMQSALVELGRLTTGPGTVPGGMPKGKYMSDDPADGTAATNDQTSKALSPNLSADDMAVAAWVRLSREKGESPTVTSVAEAIGCKRQHLYRCPTFMTLKNADEQEREARKKRLPGGSKDSVKGIEACRDT